MDRELRPEVSDAGWKWEDFVMCVCHEPMRDVEWLLYCLIGYSRTRTIQEANEWLAAHGLALQVELDGEKMKKPVLNYGSALKPWFEVDPLDSSKQLWESAIAYFDWDEEEQCAREDTVDIWHSYVALNEIMQEPYPTYEERQDFGPRSFDFFLLFVLR